MPLLGLACDLPTFLSGVRGLLIQQEEGSSYHPTHVLLHERLASVALCLVSTGIDRPSLQRDYLLQAAGWRRTRRTAWLDCFPSCDAGHVIKAFKRF